MSVVLIANILIGPSGSGKTTLAKTFDPSLWQIVCRDDIRKEILSKWNKREIIPGELWKLWKFNKPNEKRVTQIYISKAKQAFENGKNIICADTNLNEKTRLELKSELTIIGFKCVDVPMVVTLQDCILWDSKRPDSVGKTVIKRQFELYLKYTEKALHCF